VEDDNSIAKNSDIILARLLKFKQAGHGFFLMNLIYLAVAIYFIPPFNLGLTALLSLLAFLLLLGFFTYYLLQGKKLLAQILAILYGGRSVFTSYSLLAGDTFEAVPFILPCLLIAFYLLGRAAWNWP
jgi:hypothetical protein